MKKKLVLLLLLMLIFLIWYNMEYRPYDLGNDNFSNISNDQNVSDNDSSMEQKIAVPAYFYPGDLWDEMLSNTTKLEIVVMNPHNGPGDSQDSNYVNVIENVRDKGVSVFGYVYTDYGNRAINTVKEDVDKYDSYYNVVNIFLDQAPRESGLESYYSDLYDYIKDKDGKIILNPGTVPSESYMQYSDIMLIYENTYNNYINFSLSSWVNNYPAERFWHIIYSTNFDKMDESINMAKLRNSGYIYVTDDGGDNPYNTLPSYWTAEVE